jgi:hypothetical protein
MSIYQTNSGGNARPAQAAIDPLKQQLTRNMSSNVIGQSTTAQFPNSINYTTINQYQVG